MPFCLPRVHGDAKTDRSMRFQFSSIKLTNNLLNGNVNADESTRKIFMHCSGTISSVLNIS